MLRPTCRVYQLMLLVAVLALPSAWAEDRPLQIEYASSQYDASLEEAELEEAELKVAELAQCECGDCSGCAHHCFWTRPTLTGDWLGHRSCLQQRGFTFRGNVTQFGFGISGGIDTPVPPPFGQGDRFKYTGRGEYDFIFDLDKFGGLPGGKLLVGVQHWWGEFGNVSLNTGNFIPAIFPAALPPEIDDPGVPFMTDFIVTQPLAGGKLVVFAGKKNVIGAADQDIFAGGDGTDQFMNQALIANPAFLLALPYSSFTAGVALPQKWGMVSAFVYDPQDRTRDFFRLNDLFSEGIIVGGEVKVNTNFLCKPGEHHVGGLWKHTDLPDLSGGYIPPPEYPYPPAPPGVASKPDSYTIYYGFDQYLQVYSDQPRRGWGFFARASISDANPTPYRYFLSAGIGGDSPVACHRGDTFGVGWFYKGTSTKYGPVAQAVLGPQDGTGVELYYNFQVTPWLNVTPDIQYIRPDFGALGKDSFIYGLRVNMKL
jgi:porin